MSVLISEIKVTIKENQISALPSYERSSDMREIETLLTRVALENYGFFDERLEFYVDVTNGSIIAKIRYYAPIAAFALYVGIGNYGDFRSGCNQISEDLDWFKNKITYVLDANFYKSNNYGKIKIEISNGILDELKDLESKLNDINLINNHMSDNERSNLIREIKNKLSLIIFTIEEPDKEIILDLFPSYIKNNLPIPTDKERNDFLNRYGITPEVRRRLIRKKQK